MPSNYFYYVQQHVPVCYKSLSYLMNEWRVMGLPSDNVFRGRLMLFINTKQTCRSTTVKGAL